MVWRMLPRYMWGESKRRSGWVWEETVFDREALSACMIREFVSLLR